MDGRNTPPERLCQIDTDVETLEARGGPRNVAIDQAARLADGRLPPKDGGLERKPLARTAGQGAKRHQIARLLDLGFTSGRNANHNLVAATNREQCRVEPATE